jgi:two-component system CheB/CheR fusion protein
MPIDFFFQSLAKDARDRAVCIICSGLGSDGAIGLKMVMENFGMVMVQAPETAEFDSMPRAALATEFVDYVLPAEQLPAKLLEYVQRPPHRRSRREVEATASKPAHALQKIFLLIRAHTATTSRSTSATRCFVASSGA